MLYNNSLESLSNWNLIVSALWTDQMGVAETIRLIANALNEGLGLENKVAISRISVLRTSDPFVRDMTNLYPVAGPGGGVPISQLAAGEVTEGSGFVFYSQRL